MKIQNIKYIPFSLLLLFSIFSSCNKKDENTWAEINGGSAYYLAYNYQYNIMGPDSTVNTDSLIMSVNLNFKMEYSDYTFIDEINPFNPYTADYTPKLKHSISDIKLRSEFDFKNINAGDPLNDIVVVLEDPFFNGSVWTYSNTLSLQEYAYKYLVQLTNPYDINNQFFIKFKEKPNQENQKFELDFIDSQGTHFYIKLDKIKWI